MTVSKVEPSFTRLASVLIVGILAVVLDTTIVNVALDTITHDLHVPVATAQWVTTGYLLALGVAVPITGWLTDRLGGKNVWMLALAIFLVGSIGASLAPGIGTLIACRVVQGAGGGLMLPVLTNLIMQSVDPRMLGRATALVSMPAMLGPILGPLAGGLIVQHLDWRWIFWVNVPFCVAGLLLAWRFLPAFPGTGRARLDTIGFALITPGIAATVLGLARVGTEGGFAHLTVIVPLALGVALLTAFTVRAMRLGGAALVDLRLLRVPSFRAASALLFLSGFTLYGALLLVPLYLQQVRGHDPLRAGIVLAAQGVGLLAVRSLVGKQTDRLGARWIVVTGLSLVAIATVPFALAGTSTNEWWLAAALVVRGAGLGAVTVPVMAASYIGLERTAIPHASIITRTAQQIGGSFGTAVLAVVLEQYLAGHSATAAFDVAFWWSIAFTVAALLIAVRLPSNRV